MSRLSFSHILLVSFLLIAGILGTVALRGLLALEEIAVRGRDEARNAIGFNEAIQTLRARRVDMERSARQYLVLRDEALHQRFATVHQEALAALEKLEELGVEEVHSRVAEWRQLGKAMAQELDAPTASNPPLQMMPRLVSIDEELAAEVKLQMEAVNRLMLDELDHNRYTLGWHILLAAIGAVVLAGLTGWWVLRPLKRVEAAIDDLGQSRFEKPFVIGGPADLRHVGRRLDWLRVRLTDLEANRTRILRHVSHELKTPLASLREGTALLEDEVVGSLSGSQREVVDILKHNCETLQVRIEGLLGYNTVLFDAYRIWRQKCPLLPLLKQAVAEQQLMIQSRKLEVEISGEALSVEADCDKLQVVFSNLVANAVSFSPQNGRINLVLTRLAAEGRVRLDCIDEGPGVSSAEAEHIFEPFFRGSRQPEMPRNGSGLGLSIVQEFITAHGGEVMIVPSQRGAHFRVELADDD